MQPHPTSRLVLGGLALLLFAAAAEARRDRTGIDGELRDLLNAAAAGRSYGRIGRRTRAAAEQVLRLPSEDTFPRGGWSPWLSSEGLARMYKNADLTVRWGGTMKPELRRTMLTRMVGLDDHPAFQVITLPESSLRQLSSLLLEVLESGVRVTSFHDLFGQVVAQTQKHRANSEVVSYMQVLQGITKPAASSPARTAGGPSHGGYPGGGPGTFPPSGGPPSSNPGGYPGYPGYPGYGGYGYPGGYMPPSIVINNNPNQSVAPVINANSTVAPVNNSSASTTSGGTGSSPGRKQLLGPPPSRPPAAAPSSDSPRQARLSRLRARVAAIERGGSSASSTSVPPSPAPLHRTTPAVHETPVTHALPAPRPARPELEVPKARSTAEALARLRARREEEIQEEETPRLDERTRARYLEAIEKYRGKTVPEIEEAVRAALYEKNKISRFSPRAKVVTTEAAIGGMVKNLVTAFHQLEVPIPGEEPPASEEGSTPEE